MIKLRHAKERGHANHGWLDSYHTFSFGSYQDPQFMGFRNLRVINEDRVAAGKGFGTHPHNDMEIISYVVSGQLEHKDSMGNGSVIEAGEFQIITAGSGISHSEFNPSKDAPTHFYQIWVEPDVSSLAPAYGQKHFEHAGAESLVLVASKSGESDSLILNQDVRLYKGRISAGAEIELPLSSERFGWLQQVSGVVTLQEESLSSGDGASLENLESPSLYAVENSEFLFFDLV